MDVFLVHSTCVLQGVLKATLFLLYLVELVPLPLIFRNWGNKFAIKGQHAS